MNFQFIFGGRRARTGTWGSGGAILVWGGGLWSMDQITRLACGLGGWVGPLAQTPMQPPGLGGLGCGLGWVKSALGGFPHS